MVITVTIQKGPEDPQNQSPDEMASAIINALEGDESKDFCTIQVTPSPGSAGTLPPPTGAPPQSEPE